MTRVCMRSSFFCLSLTTMMCNWGLDEETPLIEGHKGTHCLFIQTCPSISPPFSAEAGILSEASKHVDFSLALTKLAQGAPGVNELVFDREGWRGGEGKGVHFHTALICLLFNAGIKSCSFLTSRGRLADSSPAGTAVNAASLPLCFFLGGGGFSYTEFASELYCGKRKKVFTQILIP